MASDTTLSEAIAALQSAQQTLVTAIAKIENHNIDGDAHQDIRELIEELLENSDMYTTEEIDEKIEELIEEHTEKDFKTAHPGWMNWYDNDYLKFQEDALSRIKVLEDEVARLKGETSTELDLEEQLQRISNKYNAMLTNLQKSLDAAIAAGDTALADEYRDSITKTLEAQSKEMIACVNAYNNVDDAVITLTNTTVSGVPGSTAKIGLFVTGSHTTTEYTITVAATNCSVGGCATLSNVNAGSVVAFTGTIAEINAEFEKAYVTVGNTAGAVVFSFGALEYTISVASEIVSDPESPMM